MNRTHRYTSFALTTLLAATAGSSLFYLHSSTFWSKDLETPFPASVWLFICLFLTLIVFGFAYAASKTIAKTLALHPWFIVVATPALAIPVLNLLTGYLFARLNEVSNVYGFPHNRLMDLFADQVLLFIAGTIIGFVIWITSRLAAVAVNFLSKRASLP